MVATTIKTFFHPYSYTSTPRYLLIKVLAILAYGWCVTWFLNNPERMPRYEVDYEVEQGSWETFYQNRLTIAQSFQTPANVSYILILMYYLELSDLKNF